MQIWRDEVAVTHFKTRTERALLAYLLLNTGQPLSRRLVASLLWPESAEAAALKSLRVVLTRLRQTLGEAQESLIIANHTQLWFNPAANYTLDVHEFEKAVQWVHTLPANEQLFRPEAIQHIRQAIALYSGELLAGFDSGSDLFDDWLATRRSELQQMAVWAGSLAIRQAEQHGDYSLMEQWARRLIYWEPWHEEAHQWLMQSLQAQGQRQAALLHYEQIRDSLATELGVAPSRQLQAFHAWLAIDKAVYPAGAQATHDRRGKGPQPYNNLPAALTPYFGRDSEHEQLIRLLTGPAHRLVTLAGPGGVGKTRMALALAHQLTSAFADGAWLIELADVAHKPAPSHTVLAREIAVALQLPINHQANVSNQLFDQLAHRHCLIVLDNIDLMLDSADFIVALLRRAPRLTLLATSREPLDCQAETVFRLDGLAVPPLNTPLKNWQQYPAGQLFVDRARRVIPSFNVDPTNWPMIITLCHQVAGTPLALELAASVLNQRTLAELVAALSHSIAVLATQRRDLPPRHRTIQATIDESWRVLPAGEQATLANLSVFRQSFSPRSAHIVSQATAAAIDSLVARSLVQRLTTGRLSLHPLLGHYAAGHLSKANEVAKQHAHHFWEQLNELKPHLFGSHPLQWAQQLEADIGNIQQAWLWFASVGDDKRLEEMVDTLIRLYHLLGRLESLEQLLQESLNDLPSPNLLIRLQLELARLLENRGELQPAKALIETVFGRLSPAIQQENWAQAHLVRGDIHQKDGYPGRAKNDFQAALTVAEQTNHLRLQIEALGRLTYFMTQTISYNERAVSLANETGDRWLQWRAINLLGISEANAGRYERAYRCFAQLLYLDGTLEMAHYRQISLFNNLGTVLQLLGDYERALTYYERGLTLAEMLGDQNGYAQAHLGLSGACRKLGDNERALASAELAAQTLLQQGSQANKLFAYLELGQAQLALGAHEAAQTSFTTALEIAELINLTMFSLLSRASLIELLLKQGKEALAASHADLICLTLQHEKLNPTLHPIYIQWQTIRALNQVADPRVAQLVQTGCAFLQQSAAQIEDRHLRHLYLNRIDVHRQLAHFGGIS